MMYPREIVVREADSALLIVGDSNDISRIDAEDGDRVAVYQRMDIKIFRTNPRLDPISRKKKR